MTFEARLVTVLPRGRRRAVRHELKLNASSEAAPDDASEAVIHNLSPSGLLLETPAKLSVGQEVVIDLPETEPSTARVVWENDKFFGCEFDSPLPPAAVSAARLRSELPAASATFNDDVDAGASLPAFGRRLQRMRKDRGFTVVELARRMNVSRPTVWSWEAGKSSPRTSKLATLSEILDVSEDELCGSGGMSRRSGALADVLKGDDLLRSVVSDMKMRLAEAAGTSSDKVKIIIEL